MSRNVTWLHDASNGHRDTGHHVITWCYGFIMTLLCGASWHVTKRFVVLLRDAMTGHLMWHPDFTLRHNSPSDENMTSRPVTSLCHVASCLIHHAAISWCHVAGYYEVRLFVTDLTSCDIITSLDANSRGTMTPRRPMTASVSRRSISAQ